MDIIERIWARADLSDDEALELADHEMDANRQAQRGGSS